MRFYFGDESDLPEGDEGSRDRTGSEGAIQDDGSAGSLDEVYFGDTADLPEGDEGSRDRTGSDAAADEGVLYEVHCVPLAPQSWPETAPDESLNPGQVPHHQVVEGSAVPGLGAAHQFRRVRVRFCHRGSLWRCVPSTWAFCRIEHLRRCELIPWTHTPVPPGRQVQDRRNAGGQTALELVELRSLSCFPNLARDLNSRTRLQ